MDGRSLAPLATLVFSLVTGSPGPAWAPAQPPQSAPLEAEPPVAAAPAPAPAKRVSAAEFTCLAMNVYWESRGQPLAGQAAVAHVTLNRWGAPSFPASICGVVHQGCQFGWTCDGRNHTPTDAAAWDEARTVAANALEGGDDPTGGALYFHQLEERPQWAKGRYGQRVVIGNHIFFNVKEGSERQLAQSPPDP